MIDLKNPFVFRDLSGPMGVQNPTRAEQFRERFTLVEEDAEFPPFHYGNQILKLSKDNLFIKFVLEEPIIPQLRLFCIIFSDLLPIQSKHFID